MAILCVASEAFELEPFAELLTGLRKLSWPIEYAFEGILQGRRVLLAANGAGPKLAMRATEIAIRSVTNAELSASKLEAVVSTGLCGALDPNLVEGQIIVASEVLDLATKETFACSAVMSDPKVVSGLIVTQDRIANNAAEKQQLRNLGAIAVEMEAASVAARAKRAELPFYCIKTVLDPAGESFRFDLNKMRATSGRIARGKISLYALAHLNLVPELLRLKRRADHAAMALGDFLVSCRINSESDANRAE